MRMRKSISGTFLFNTLLLIFISFAGFGYLVVFHENAKFAEESEKIREGHIEARKLSIADEVDRVVSYVDFRRKTAETRLRKGVRERVYEACAMAENLHLRYGGEKSVPEIRDLVKETLRAVRFNDGNGYYVIIDMAGKGILLPGNPAMEGKSLLDIRDGSGRYFIREFARIASEQKEGYQEWLWNRPGESDASHRKIGFIKRVEPLGILIGTGEYVADVEEEIRRDLLSWINRIRYGDNGYIFVYDFKAVTLAHYRAGNIGVNRWNFVDADGTFVVRRLIEESKKPQGGYVRYMGTVKPATGKPAPKIGYAKSIPEWGWMIGTGAYLDDIEAVIGEERERLAERVEEQLIRMGAILAGLLCTVLLVAQFFTKRTKESFRRFTAFFEKAASESIRIDPDGLHFAELKNMAHAANRMIEGLEGAQASLRESEGRLRAIFNTQAMGISVLDSGGRFLRYNRKWLQMTGYGEKEMACLTNRALTHPSDMAETERMAALLNGKVLDTVSFEKRFLRKDGSHFWGSVNVSVSRKGKRAGSAVVMVIDITARKVAEQEKEELAAQLSRSKKMEAVGLLAGGVAHDLNNILSGVVSYPELILMQLSEESELRKPIELIRSSGERAAAVVSDLLTLSRGVAGSRDVLNLSAIATDYMESPEHLRLSGFAPGVTFVIRCDPVPAPVSGSAIHVRKALMNLVFNAAEAIESAGEIVVSVENRTLSEPLKGYEIIPAGAYVQLAVSDSGSGIAEGDRERIFEPFYTRKKMGRSGTGLGLAVVWNTMRDTGGYIDLTSGSAGTTITLYFPVTCEEPSPESRPLPAETYRGSGETVLVVDDEKNQREIATQILRELGYRVTAVPSGEAAVALLEQRKMDIVMLDMIMAPGMSGLEAFEHIVRINPRQNAFMASGYARSGDVEKARELGVSGFVSKPYSIEEIGLAVRNALEEKM